MKVVVEVTDILADSEIRSELRDYALHGDVALGGLAVKIVGVVEERTVDGYRQDGTLGHVITKVIVPVEVL